MTRASGSTIDVDLQVRVQIALNQWARRQATEGCSTTAHQDILAIANKYGEVTLKGRVDGRFLSQQATEVAQQVQGVRLVFNHIATSSNSTLLQEGIRQVLR
jgi:osmotically-inducible protein OsmY